MLIIKAYINENLIDKILIYNTGSKNKKGEYIYHIGKCNDYDNFFKVAHKREDGWQKLAIKVLKKLEWREKCRKVKKEHFLKS